MAIKLLHKTQPELSLKEELLAEFPEAVAEERPPTDAELKAKVRELHETGGREEAIKELLTYLKSRPKTLTLRQKVAKWSSGIIFVVALLTTGFGAWWFLYGAQAIDDGFVVCRIGTVEYQGEICLTQETGPEETPEPRPPAVQPGDTRVQPGETE